jgi:hypothetical protein
MDDTKELFQVGYRVTPRFARWMKAERARRFLTTAGLLQELALEYVLKHPEAAPWDEREES